MLDLPKSTEFNKRIPKQKFYEKIDVSPALKRVFVEQIKIIYWRNKLAATTLNLAPGTSVDEIEIIEIKLSSQELDVAVLRQIDKEIPYHILFVLECEGKYRAVIGYKEKSISCWKGLPALGPLCLQQKRYIQAEACLPPLQKSTQPAQWALGG